jgi:hypothetical protein
MHKVHWIVNQYMIIMIGIMNFEQVGQNDLAKDWTAGV